MGAHYARWKECGDFRDLCAYYMIGYNFTEAHRVSASAGGKIGGRVAQQGRLGIHTADTAKRKEWASRGGKAGGKRQKEEGLGIHAASAEQQRAWSSLGGKRGAFTQPAWQSEFGKRGGVKNKGFVWLTDGGPSFKYTPKMQAEKPLATYLKENKNIRRGYIYTKKRRVWVNNGVSNFMAPLADGQSVEEFLSFHSEMKRGRMRENKDNCKGSR